VHVRRHDPEAVMAVLASDHIITRPAEFMAVLLASSQEAAESNALITMGIPPTEPSTEFGYIHRGELHAMRDGRPVYKVESFKEKPDARLAGEFLRMGEYYWNANICCYKAGVMLDQMAELMPDLHRGLQKIAQAIGTADEERLVRQVYPTLPKETIDTGILEKSDHVLTIPADIGWNDVGTWSALHAVLAGGKDGNVALGGGRLLAIDTSRTLVCSPDNLIIVDSPTALLVCDRSRATEVKRIVEQLEAEGRYELL
jgi:mannose-1-phosphate guanylyltransferase